MSRRVFAAQPEAPCRVPPSRCGACFFRAIVLPAVQQLSRRRGGSRPSSHRQAGLHSFRSFRGNTRGPTRSSGTRSIPTSASLGDRTSPCCQRSSPCECDIEDTTNTPVPCDPPSGSDHFIALNRRRPRLPRANSAFREPLTAPEHLLG